MKKRIFYVINLDNRRIFTLSIFLVALLFSFFFLGLSVGKRKGMMEAYKYDTTGPAEQIAVANATDPATATSQEIVELKNQSALVTEADKTAEPVAGIHNNAGNTDSEKNQMNESIGSEKSHEASEPKLVTTKSAKKTKTVKKSEKSYSVQVAAFNSKEQAEKSAEKIKANSKFKSEPFIEKSGNHYLVKVGNYSKRSAAEKALPGINKSLKVKGMITKE